MFCLYPLMAAVSVVIPHDPHPTVAIAAEEFAKYYRAITDTRCVITEHPSSDDCCIRLQVAPDEAAQTDAYEVASDGTGLRISGVNPRSVLYGVYDFFRTHCGCAWFWDGDVVPKRDRIDFSGVNIRERARFRYRGCQYFAHRGLTRFQAEHWGFGDWKRELDWCAKNRINVIKLQFGREDFFQLAYPDIVPYPDPAVTERFDASDGYNQRTACWSRQFRHQLRRNVLDYARARGMFHPEKIGPMAHWFFRTPQELLEARRPDFMPQVDNRYTEPSGLVWDVRKPEWFEAYWKLTEAACKAYGEPGMFFNPGFDERTVFSNREDNVRLKIDIVRRYNEESYRRRPDAQVVIEGWDLQMGWRPEEVSRLVSELDPKRTVIWNFTSDVVDFPPEPMVPQDNLFTEWGVTNRFPYTFGMMLSVNRVLDIRGQYDVIRKRERLVADDPMCVGYLIWPENSHTDIFAWRYFTENCWQLSPKSTAELLADFCRDRYAAQAGQMERIWKTALAVSQLSGAKGPGCHTWGRTLPRLLVFEGPNKCNEPERWLSSTVPQTVQDLPDAFRMLSAIDWQGERIRRDTVDLARTLLDVGLWQAYEQMLKAYHLSNSGKVLADDVRQLAAACRKLVRQFSAVLDLHTDYSVAESLDRLNQVERIRNPEFESVLFENSVCDYCLSHHAEYARSIYVPMTDDMAEAVDARAMRGGTLPRPEDRRKQLKKRDHPIRDFAPDPAGRTPERYHALMEEIAMTLDGVLNKP